MVSQSQGCRPSNSSMPWLDVIRHWCQHRAGGTRRLAGTGESKEGNFMSAYTSCAQPNLGKGEMYDYHEDNVS